MLDQRLNFKGDFGLASTNGDQGNHGPFGHLKPGGQQIHKPGNHELKYQVDGNDEDEVHGFLLGLRNSSSMSLMIFPPEKLTSNP